MLPFHWTIGPLTVAPNDLFVMLAVVLVGWVARNELRKVDDSDKTILALAMTATACGVVGAHFCYVLPMLIRGQIGIDSLFSAWKQGSCFYGGFIGGAIGIAVLTHLRKLPTLRILDAVCGSLPVGFAVGKIGCLLSGCCYGLPVSFGLRFEPGSFCYRTQVDSGQIQPDARFALPVHPVQLYDIVFSIVLYWLLRTLQRRHRRPGVVLMTFLVAYSVYRFFIEFIRDDPNRHVFGGTGLSDAQYIGIVLFATICIIALCRSKPPNPSY